MRTIAIANRKGGVGKSTTAVHLAAGLALGAGKSTLLIDGDTQGHCAKLLGVGPGPGLADVLLDDETAYNAVVEARPNLWLLRGGPDLAGVSRLIARENVSPERFMTRKLADVRSRYQVCVMDMAPGYNELSINMLVFAEELIVPVTLEALAADGLVTFMSEVHQLRELANLDLPYRILPTMEDNRTKQTSEILEQLQRAYGSLVLDAIPTSADVKRLGAFGQTIYELAPKDRAAAAYGDLTGLINAELVYG